jgi:hypothetical protein
MRRPNSGLRMWSLGVAVAIVAVSFAAARAESAPGAAIVIVGTCVSLLAYKRYSEAIALRQAGDATISRSQKAGLVLTSATFALAIIGLSDLAFLAGYYGFLRVAYEAVVWSHWTPYDDRNYMGIGVVIGVALALCVASSVRHLVRSPEATRTHLRWLRLWPIALTVCVGSLLVAEEMRERYSYCRMMADYHAERAQRIRPSDARIQGPDGDSWQPSPEAVLRRAGYHRSLTEKYDFAARYPWLPIAPDPPEPQ